MEDAQKMKSNITNDYDEDESEHNTYSDDAKELIKLTNGPEGHARNDQVEKDQDVVYSGSKEQVGYKKKEYIMNLQVIFLTYKNIKSWFQALSGVLNLN